MLLTKLQLQSHIQAAKKLDKIKRDVFEFIKSGATEYEAQQFILKKFKEENLTSGRMRPIVATNKNSKDPHYTPTEKKKNDIISEGSLIMIDLWAKEKSPYGVYADITWMASVKKSSPLEGSNGVVNLLPSTPTPSLSQTNKIFRIVIGARDEAVKFIKKRLKENKPILGYEVDKIARNYIAKRGYGKNFIHSTGHSLDKNVHGSGVSLSSIKKKNHKLARKKNKRKIPQNSPFTIEPGIYLDDFGVRSEIDCYIDDRNKLVITTEAQKKIVEI
ncbi:MAG: M24 family metallopeptidase [bacterium]